MKQKETLNSTGLLKKTTIIGVLLWIFIQLILIYVFYDTPQRSDQGVYLKIAQDCFDCGEWYPMRKHIYEAFIWAPGLINFFICQLKIFGTLKLNMFFNLLMNIAILYEVWWLAKRFFSIRTAYISVLCYCILYSNSMIVLPAGTEIPFLFLALTSFCLCLSNKYWKLVVAGILFALANWIRPLTIIFLPVALFYMFLKKYNWKSYPVLLIPFFSIIILIGTQTQSKIGYYVFQSSTSGVNLIMTANDKAYGGVATSLMGDTTNTCYIRNAQAYTFAQKDSIWRQRAIKWIKENPGQFGKLYLMKLGGLYIEDSWPDRPILGGDGFIDKAAHNKVSKSSFISRIFSMGLKSLVYYVILFFFVYAIAKHIKELLSWKGFLLLILLLGTLSTCIFSVSPRYHYPFLFVIIIWAAYGIETSLSKINKS